MKENENALKKMTLGDVLDYSIQVYKRNFKKLTLLALIFNVPFMFLYTLATNYITKDYVNYTQNNYNVFSPSYTSDIISGLVAFLITLFIMLLILLIYSITIKPVMDAAIIKLVYSDVVSRKKLKLGEVIRSGFKRFPGLMGNKILFYLLLLGIGLLAFIAFIIVVSIVTAFVSLTSVSQLTTTGFSTASAVGAVVAFYIVIFAALIFIGILFFYFISKFMFGQHSLIVENKSVGEGFSRSISLTGKSFWRYLFFQYFFGTIIFLGVPWLISYSSSLIPATNYSLLLLLTVITQIISSLIHPAIVTLSTIIFINLKVVKEGLDIEVKVDTLLEQQKKQLENVEIGEINA